MGIRDGGVVKFIESSIDPDQLTVHRSYVNQAGGLGCQE